MAEQKDYTSKMGTSRDGDTVVYEGDVKKLYIRKYSTPLVEYDPIGANDEHADFAELAFTDIEDLATEKTSAQLGANDYIAVGKAKTKLSAISDWIHGRWASFVNALTAKTSFASGDKIAVVNGSTATAMGKDDLLKETAQNALSGNVSPKFDPTKPNDEGGYAYYSGENVEYEGKNYVFVMNHSSGAWNASEVEQKPLSKTIALEGVGQAVQEWLDEHPEATTTVENYSLTYKKLVKGTLNFVTPEMYGASGDGITDDTEAFRQAMESRLPVVGDKNKFYCIESLSPIHAGTQDKPVFLIDCNFKALSDSPTKKGVQLWFHINLYHCSFKGFEQAVFSERLCVTCNVVDCFFTECKNGCWLEFGDTNTEVSHIFACSFVRNDFSIIGTHSNQSLYYDDDGSGYGIKIIGGWSSGVVIANNIFQGCSHSGISLDIFEKTNTFSSFFIHDNYFERCNYTAIELNKGNDLFVNKIEVDNNFFSPVDPDSVTASTLMDGVYINPTSKIRTSCKIKDTWGEYIGKFMYNGNQLYNGTTHRMIINNDNFSTGVSPLYHTINPFWGKAYPIGKGNLGTPNECEVTIKIIYYLSADTTITIPDRTFVGSGNYTFTLEAGFGEKNLLLPAYSSWTLSRYLSVAGEFIEIVDAELKTIRLRNERTVNPYPSV